MFGRKKLECPRCKKMFRKKDMRKRSGKLKKEYDGITTNHEFTYFNPTAKIQYEILCNECMDKMDREKAEEVKKIEEEHEECKRSL